MSSTPNFAAMAEAARRHDEQQEAAEQARLQEELDLSAGQVFAAFEQVYASDTLDHQTKLSRFTAAKPVLDGHMSTVGTPVPAPAPVATPASASSVPFDYASLPEETRQIIDMVAAEPGRFKVEEWGAVKDKSYTKLRKDHQAASVSSGGEATSSTPAEPATKKASVPAPAKKTASDTSGDEPEAEGEVKTGGTWSRIKSAAKEAAQNAKQ